jgi:hypothetical protein
MATHEMDLLMGQKVSVYPFHFSDKYMWAWVFRRDEENRPIIHSIRIRRYPNNGAFWNPNPRS